MLRWVKPWPTNSQLRSTQALTIVGKGLDRDAVDVHHAGNLEVVIDLSSRQNPTRLPYSCQHQFGMSGIGEPPAGGVSTVRGMRLGRVPFLDVGDGPHHHARASSAA